MRILHYILGTPPVRDGGLVKYVHDLMSAQQNRGEEVTLLVPGSINRKRRNETYITSMRSWKSGISQYQIKNALPIAMAKGIKDIEWYTTMGNYGAYKDFLQTIFPDIIHVHSLMGIHANFFVAAHDLEIPIVFTTHDFFGVCPKTQFIDWEGNCERADWSECWKCCQGALSSAQLIMEQSRLYRYYRDNSHLTKMVQIVRKNLKCFSKSKTVQENIVSSENNENVSKEYEHLKKYYQMIFKEISMFHYNSSIAKKQYEKCMPFVKGKGKIISITNAEIKDNREKKVFGATLRIGYLGGIDKNKGYYFLEDVVRQVVKSGRENIELHVYMPGNQRKLGWICSHEPYKYSELSTVMRNLDIVAVPSLLKETFGFVALEAWSYGVPVILTETVGAKDILANRNWGYCVPACQGAWKEVIEKIYDNRDFLHIINENICNDKFEFLMENHLNEINMFYKETIDMIDKGNMKDDD